jgi:START domain
MFSNVFGSSKSEWKYDDLPTPQSDMEYSKLARDVLRHRKRMIDSDGWETVKDAVEYDDVSIEKKAIEGSDIAIVRVTGFAKLENGKTIDDLMMQLFNPTLEQRRELQSSVTEHSRLKNVSEHINISRTVGRQTGLSDREFITMRTYEKTDDGYMVAVQSINDEDHPFDSNCVRATSMSGTLMTTVTDSIVQIASIDHIDPKGWVPSAIINSFISSAGDWISKV